jgi:hypothetical protein
MLLWGRYIILGQVGLLDWAVARFCGQAWGSGHIGAETGVPILGNTRKVPPECPMIAKRHFKGGSRVSQRRPKGAKRDPPDPHSLRFSYLAQEKAPLAKKTCSEIQCLCSPCPAECSPCAAQCNPCSPQRSPSASQCSPCATECAPCASPCSPCAPECTPWLPECYPKQGLHGSLFKNTMCLGGF